MSVFTTLIICLFCISGSSFAGAYRVSDLVDQALHNNFEIKRKKSELKISNLDVTLFKKKFFLPHLTYQLQAYDKNTYKGFITESTQNNNGDTLYSSKLGLSFDVFNGLKDYYKFKLAKANREISRLSYNSNIEELIYDVKALYLDLSLEISRLNIIRDELIRDKKLLKTAKTRFKKGLIARSDLKRAEIQLLGTKNNQTIQDNVIENIKITLQNTIGKNLETPFTISSINYFKLENNVNKLIQEIKKSGIKNVSNDFYNKYQQKGTELKKFRQQKMANDYSLGVTRGDFLPKLSIEAYHDYSFTKNLGNYDDSKADSFVFALTLTIPIFDSFDTMIAHKQKKLEVLNSEFSVAQDEHNAYNQIKKLLGDLISEYKSYQILKESHTLRKSIYKTSTRRYYTGGISTKDLIDDKIELQEELIALARKGHNIRKLYLKIQKLTGSLLESGDDYESI